MTSSSRGSVITPEHLTEILDGLGGDSRALHLESADDLLATIRAGHRWRQALDQAVQNLVACRPTLAASPHPHALALFDADLLTFRAALHLEESAPGDAPPQ